jgi:aminoglycoside phosphotransferase (APT) family kinase protein
MTAEDDDALAQALADALGTATGDGSQPEIAGLRRLSGGASRETWAFDAVLAPGAAPHRLILQRTRPGASFSGPSMAVEDRLLAAAAGVGVPVPPTVLDAAACAPWLGEARVTGFIDGDALGPRIVRGEAFAPARQVLVGQCARALGAIHSIDPSSVPGLEEIDPLARLRDGLDLLHESRPTFEVAMRWLAEHRPPTPPSALVHGDFRVGNLLVDPDDGLRAVLDWELAHLGDPLEDLGWLCVRAWRFGGAGEAGGIDPLSDLIDAYANATGVPIDPSHVRWWLVAGTLTWGLICAVQGRRHLDGQVRSVELATIGRRVVETEYDLCQLLDIGAEPTVTGGGQAAKADGELEGVDRDHEPGDAQGAPAPIERPTAVELVDAVRTHLADQVVPLLDGSAAFQLKVTGNALAIIEREFRLGPVIATRATAALSTIGVSDERTLATAIRLGDIDVSSPQVARTVRTLVVDRLRIANPRWLQPPEA